MLRISNLKIRENLSNDELLKTIIKKFKLDKNDIINWEIIKKSIDARKKDDVHFIYSINLIVKDDTKYKNLERVSALPTNYNLDLLLPQSIMNTNSSFSYSNLKPVIIGAGPAGLFAALTLVENGIAPIVVEQGKTVEERQKEVDSFISGNSLNPFCNIQFGEGGAGTFSDGKLNSGIHSPYCKNVHKAFVKFGAPEEIMYISKPHIGTDNLVKIIHNMRIYLEEHGTRFYFNTKAIDFSFKYNSAKTQEISNIICEDLVTKNRFELQTNSLILAIGHSSRDTFRTLYNKGINMEAKNFSVGVRIEHLQSEIDKAQYGEITKLKLPPAEYKLAYHSLSGRSCYTFCMCPGGTVMASSSDPNTVVTNGMSKFARDGKNANSAVLVNVTPQDFPSNSPLAGIDFQNDLETKAFNLGGKNYFAPVQRWQDFYKNRKSLKIGKITPSYLPGYTLANLNEILPDFVCSTLKEAILYFDTKLKGFANPDSILTGVETRSSSPVKIPRKENFECNVNGIYPCGEGAGYAGGIMSAAVDGIKCAFAVLTNNLD